MRNQVTKHIWSGIIKNIREASVPPPQWRLKLKGAGAVSITLMFLFAGAVTALHGVRQLETSLAARKLSVPQMLKAAKEQSYFPLTSDVHLGESQWLFDGRFILHGTVVDWWRADTKKNQISCKNEWRKLASYRPLCTSIADQNILAVKVEGINHQILTYIPVSRIAHIDAGDTVSIRAGIITEDNRVEKLPALLNYHHPFSPVTGD